MYHHTDTLEREAHADMISHGLHHASTYPATTQKGVADLCLCQLAAMYVQMLGMSLFCFFSHLLLFVAIFFSSLLCSMFCSKLLKL